MPANKSKLTPRQQTFCMLVATGLPYCEAWIASGHSKKMALIQPYRAVKNPAIKAKIAEYQAQFAAESGLTVAALLAELELTRQRAVTAGQFAAAAAASMGKAKICGFLVDKVEDVTRRVPSLIPTKATEIAPADWLKMVNEHRPGVNGKGNGQVH